MEETILNAKGQLTLPASIRKKLGTKAGMRFLWGLMPDGTLIVQPKNKSLLDMAGMLKPRKGLHVSIEEMNPWV
ncbi:AbrB/MazE/SpoVT family DNA-binding domain-containing protein [Roseateles noduli]|uniref:AbrB/MazE/SpoVT family DNA-binding domain-containing protein n=1 Tax=Roseateles noduli TaxID=2052484 RepID=UPI003D656619